MKTFSFTTFAAIAAFSASLALPAAARQPAPQQALQVHHYATVQQAHHRWRVGQRLPASYRKGTVNWRAHRLSRPPRGQRWVRLGRGYARITPNGIIRQLVGV